MYIDLQVKTITRETATGYPVSSYSVEETQNCNESIEGVLEIAAGAGPTEINIGSIAKGRFFFLNVIEDETNGREPLEVRINGSANDAWVGTLMAYEADTTTGITSIYVTNAGSNSIKYRYLVGGDVS